MTTWQDPPASGPGRRAKYITPEIAADLRANPGRWLLLDHHDRKAATAIRNWITRHSGFEQTARSDGAGYDIYVRCTDPHH